MCNGTKLTVGSFRNNIIEATIVAAPNAGDIVYITRIKLIIMADGKNPYDFICVQFPARLAFSMTISKAQGQTLDTIGLYFSSQVFGLGQLYIALSRVSKPSSIKNYD